MTTTTKAAIRGWVATATILAATAGLRAVELDYHADVAPLLRDYCSGCHNQIDREGDVSVETFGDLMKGGDSDDETMLVPGEPSQSYLLQTVLKQADPTMPPDGEPRPEEDEIAILTRWIEQGAEGPPPEEDLSILSTLSVPNVEPADDVDDAVTAVAHSADGELLAVARFGRVEISRTDSGKVVRRLDHGEGKINAVHFSPDGKRLVTASGITGLKGVAVIWDLETGKKVREIGGEAHRDILFDAEFSPDGKLLATAGYDRVIRLWEVETGHYVRKFPSHNGAVYDLAFSPDGGVLASASGDATGKVWDVASGKRLDTLNQPQAEQYRIDFTPDGRFIVGAGADNRIRLWRFVSKGESKINPVVHAKFGHEDAIVEMAVSGDGKWLATTSADRALKLWSLPDLRQATDFATQPDVISALSFGPGGTLLAARLDGSLGELGIGTVSVADADAGSGEAGGSGGSLPDGPTTVRAPGEKPPERTALEENESGENPALVMPSEVSGAIAKPGDTDEYRFTAREGETWIFETRAERADSKLDSHLAVLDDSGEPVERVVLQATRDSWLTFRGKDSTGSGDFRVHNWREMDLNEYLYVNGEVVKLWHYPRGPDSGFIVYPGFGSRHTFFETTGLAHPVGQPCYIVRALPPGSDPSPNGLPVYRLYYENDDEASRSLGSDSKVTFIAPADGVYRVRVSDVRGFGGEGHHYRLVARRPQPDFSVSIGGKNPKISPGSATEISFTAKRSDGFDGPIEIRLANLPEGLSAPDPVVIQEDQYRAVTVLRAAEGFEGVPEERAKRVAVTASAEIAGERVEKSLGHLGKLQKGPKPKVLVEIRPDGDSGRMAEDGVVEFTIRPGQTITAEVVAHRQGAKGRLTFGKEDAGRNFPHGVYVDNIGLNGLMIPEGANRQQFFITADDVVGETVRHIHLHTGKQASPPARLRVVQGGEIAEK